MVRPLLSAIRSKAAMTEETAEALAVPVVVAMVTCITMVKIKSPVELAVLMVQMVAQDTLTAVLVKAQTHVSLANRPANCTRVVAVAAQERSVTFTLKLERVVKVVAVLAAKVVLELLALKIPEVVAVEVLRPPVTQIVCPALVALASSA